MIATKVGAEMAPDRKGLSHGLHPRAVEDSLRRLQTDRIDLYQSHATTRRRRSKRRSGLRRPDRPGKVRAIGASNFSGAAPGRGAAIGARDGLPRYESLQPHYNLYDRAEYEEELAAALRRERALA